ncbi:DUF4158 domain-containing protein [Nonomuraea sp. NPDC048901]|uniref:DUF4158 domain-containing protein n=1 Tax=Nonomuraea sp. NPDC048901 TaxID=3155627 RepID=UPI0033F9B427
MGCFPKLADVPEMVAEFVRRVVELPEGTIPVHARRAPANSTGLIRQRVGLTYDQAQARKVADEVIRTEAAAKNDPADLINTALEKLVETGLELPAFSTLDAMASALRAEVNKVICGIIYERLSEAHRERLLKLLTERGLDGKTLFNRLKQSAERASWSHFKDLAKHLAWVDGLGDSTVWLQEMAAGKVADFAEEAAAADAGVLGDYAVMKRAAVLACLVHKARMRARDELATMFVKRVAAKVKRAKT